MATLGSIRKRSGLLIIVIGIAMLSFILTDLLRSGTSLFQSEQNKVANIDGKDIDYKTFSRMVQVTAENYKQSGREIPQMQVVNLVWDELVKNTLIQNQIDKVGLKLSNEELWQRIISHPNILTNQSFKGENGSFDENKLKQYISSIQNSDTPESLQALEQWLNFEKNLKLSSTNQEYIKLLKEAIFVTDFEAKQNYKEQNEKIDIDYIYLPYSSVNDIEVKVLDSEIQKYIEDHKDDFKKKESRDIQYVTFDISPSLEDENEVMENMKSIKNEFKSIKNIAEFVNENSDVPFYDRYYYNKDKDYGNNDALREFAKKGKKGDFSEIYKNNDTYNISKIMDIKMLPDSVKAKHILIGYKGSQSSENTVRTKEQAKTLADSLYKVIRKKKNFEKLAKQFSDGPSKTKGGDLGWFTYYSMVKNFNDFCFIDSKKNKLGVVETEFGYHVIQVNKIKNVQRTVKIATITQNIIPSETTENEIYTKALNFARKNNNVESFINNAKLENLELKLAEGLSKMDFNVPGSGAQRSIVRWSFDPNTQFESVKLFNQNNSYIVVIVSGLYSEGLSSIEEAKAEVTKKIRQAKKAVILKNKFSTIKSNDLKDIANKLNETIKTVTGISFNSPIISGIGTEPNIIGTAFGLKINTVSKPIEGENGVFMVQTIAKNKVTEENNYKSISQKLKQDIDFKMSSGIIEALKSNAKIEDNRAKFY